MKEKPTKLERKKTIRIIYMVIIVVLLSSTLFFGRNSFFNVMRKKIEISKLQKKVDQLKAENEQLRKENHSLKTDPEVIEKIAREKLGFSKSEEKVYRFMPPAENENLEQKEKK